MKILILGVNGFIGNALTRRILAATDWEIHGMDLSASKLGHSLGDPRFHFLEGDMTVSKDWVDRSIDACDVVLPLVAIATPATYVKDPLRVFELDFEENLRVVRRCVGSGKRVVFPSTSEVYGMCADPEFLEDESVLVTGPIAKPRWIYSCAKQLLDRVIAAYGQQAGLQYTCFRPFNWIGPKLDSIDTAKEGSSRVVTQFMVDLAQGSPIRLVDGGEQKRCFTYLEDGIDGLMKILENRDGICDSEIFNLGNPANECSVRELAEKLVALFKVRRASLPAYREPRIEGIGAEAFYGRGYQDIAVRKPSVEKARRLLGWEPRTSLDTALGVTMDAFLDEWNAAE